MKHSKNYLLRILTFLRDVQLQCNEGDITTITPLCHKHSVSHIIIQAMKKRKVIKRSLETNKLSPWVWNTIQPNMHMAKALADDARKIRKSKKEARKPQPKLRPVLVKGIKEDPIKVKSDPVISKPNRKTNGKKSHRIRREYRVFGIPVWSVIKEG